MCVWAVLEKRELPAQAKSSIGYTLMLKTNQSARKALFFLGVVHQLHQHQVCKMQGTKSHFALLSM